MRNAAGLDNVIISFMFNTVRTFIVTVALYFLGQIIPVLDRLTTAELILIAGALSFLLNLFIPPLTRLIVFRKRRTPNDGDSPVDSWRGRIMGIPTGLWLGITLLALIG